jgi:hypothetical protein
VIVSPLAALGSYVLAGFNDEKRDVRTSERESVARTEVDRLAQNEKSRNFRLEVLLSLQDALQEFAIATGKVNTFDYGQLRKVGELTRIPVDSDQRMHDALVNLRRLKERVPNDDFSPSASFLITCSGV